MSGQSLHLDRSHVQRTLLPPNPVIILGGHEVLVQYNKKLDREIMLYNRRLEALSSPIFIRDRHMSNGRVYHGRYFYKKVWDDDQGKIREIYIGLTVPEEDDGIPEGGFPPPPIDPLAGFEYHVMYGNVICSRDMYDRFHRIFTGKNILVLRLDESDE